MFLPSPEVNSSNDDDILKWLEDALQQERLTISKSLELKHQELLGEFRERLDGMCGFQFNKPLSPVPLSDNETDCTVDEPRPVPQESSVCGVTSPMALGITFPVAFVGTAKPPGGSALKASKVASLKSVQEELHVHKGARSKSPDAEPPEAHRTYKPIVLNDCAQIIPNLYLGGVDAVTDSQHVSSQGIKAICCCLREMEYPSCEFCQDVEYYRVDVEDMGREPIELYFPVATEFIHSWISREQPVIVHCRAGVSRSASVVIAYLMIYQGYSLHEAFFVVRSHRSVATPNIGFMEKLCEFEEEHRFCSPSIDINKYESWYTSPERGAVPDLIPD
mmetsp:Transcript_63621/g.125884  ORF Transcript_63621/g.125884 Transcript_63621/m.125884 type:complete len:334 (+) Transcript_63621:95-1096(+)